MTASHDHGPISYGKAFAIGITLNVAFVLIEAFYGGQTGSLALLALPGVVDVHDLHVWAMSTSDNALSAHLVIGEERVNRDALLEQATLLPYERFSLRHCVLQLESREYATHCPVGERC